MNSRQRRRCYRALPKAGTKLIYRTSRWEVPVTVIGKSGPIAFLANGTFGYNTGALPSTRRVKCSYDDGTGATCMPLLSRLRPA